MKLSKYSLCSGLVFFLIIAIQLQGNELTVKVIENTEDLPHEFSRIWKTGDILISDGKNLALIGGAKRPLKTFHAVNAMGSILSFIPAKENLVSDLGIGAPMISIKYKRKYPIYSSLKQLKKNIPEGTLAFEANAAYEEEGKRAEIKTTYKFFAQEGGIDVISTIKNTGKEKFRDLEYSVYFTAFHSYYFSPFNREKHPHLNFRVYQKKGHYLAWLNLNPYSKKILPGKLASGEHYKVHYALLTDTRIENLLKKVYQIFEIDPLQAKIHLKNFKGGLAEIIIRDAFSPAVFFRSFLEDPLFLEIPFPKGTYLVKAHFFPAVQEEILAVETEGENSCILEDIPSGTLDVKIRDSKGEFVPGKVAFIGLHPTKTPYFKPENPLETEKRWESFKNSCYPLKEGMKVKMPIGTYLVYASRGPEYTIDQKIIEVLKNEYYKLTFRIDKVIDKPNLISIDPHMHTQVSDGTLLIPERIKSVLAEGVDVAVATDHNYIIDYIPDLKKLGLSEYLAVIPGSEVTHGGVIHYNSFPLEYRPQEENNGAIYPLAEEASTLFKASRKKYPDAILQVNHPRAGRLGYFNTYYLDKESASYALKTFDTSFDVFEVMNGPYFYNSNSVAIEDWFHLLNRGYYFPLMGSSDSHAADRGEPGFSRTYVYYQGGKATRLNVNALILALKKGHSFATNGPLIELKVNKKYKPGDSFTAKEKNIDIRLEVISAPWVDVDDIRIIINGERKITFPVKKEEKLTQNLIKEISLMLERDSYIVGEVLGKKTLYPVVQRPSWNGEREEAVLPYALTNPVFIDVDGNGSFDPPWPEKIRLTTDIPEQKETVRR
ncbi:MAG: CehA/McbA family metallohydrolase [Candidatus Aminicenantaceae bacterium]